jgi:membrane-bound serine protease (ClpP class)
MKPILCLTLVAALTFAGAAPRVSLADEDLTYIIPIKGMIERGLLYSFRRAIREAEDKGAGAIIIDMDTPGGKLQSAEEIVLLLLNTEIPTYTFVNPRAISAGAIISLATDEIYMTPTGLIGDAMPIMMSPIPGQAPTEPSAGLREKIMSPTIALVRSAAQAKGHDPELGAAMVRPELEYKVGDKIICPEGELLTLTSQEAVDPIRENGEPLLAKGIAKNMEECLALIGRQDSTIVRISISPSEKIARVIEGFTVSGILMGLGMLGLWIEFKTPGFGFPGIAGLLCLAIWFWGHNIAGLSGTTELMLFAIGAVLLLMEIFIIPGFGIAGIGGLALIVVSVMLSMVHGVPTDEIDIPTVTFVHHEWEWAIIKMGMGITLTTGMAIVLARYLPETTIFRHLALSTEMRRQEGYQGSSEHPDLVGARGTAVTTLRPAGIGIFDGKRINVISRGTFIDKDASIVIAEANGNRIVVEQLG